MKTSSAEILKSIPDYEDFISLGREISELMLAKLSLEVQIKSGEANVFKTCSTDDKYFQNGKPAPTSFIENTYKFTGLNGELIPLRERLVSVMSDLEERRLRMETYKSLIDIWRTLSSSERTASL